jgi:hypothetical protein
MMWMRLHCNSRITAIYQKLHKQTHWGAEKGFFSTAHSRYPPYCSLGVRIRAQGYLKGCKWVLREKVCVAWVHKTFLAFNMWFHIRFTHHVTFELKISPRRKCHVNPLPLQCCSRQ